MLKANIFQPIYEGKLIDGDDLVKEQREAFFQKMESFEMPRSTTFGRFFKKGFAQWEIEGVDAVKRKFVEAYSLNFPPDYNFLEDKRNFYEILLAFEIPLSDFYDYMKQKGMKSSVTIKCRFALESWKAWEKMGIRKILTDYEREA